MPTSSLLSYWLIFRIHKLSVVLMTGPFWERFGEKKIETEILPTKIGLLPQPLKIYWSMFRICSIYWSMFPICSIYWSIVPICSSWTLASRLIIIYGTGSTRHFYILKLNLVVISFQYPSTGLVQCTLYSLKNGICLKNTF